MKENKTTINNTTNETKSEKRIRLVKRNWIKISIIVGIIVVLLTGLGVGLYFLLRKEETKYSEVATEMKFGKSPEEVRNDIFDGGNKVSIFFYKEDETTANFLMYGNESSENVTKDSRGALSEYVNSSSKDKNRTWYGVDINETSEWIESLLTHKTDSGEYVFYDQFESLGNGTPEKEQWYIETADGSNGLATGSGESTTPESEALDYFSMKVRTNDNDTSDILFDDGTSTDGGNAWSPKSGTTMWFGDNGEVETIINDWTTTSDDGEIDEYNSFYENWLTLLEERDK